jgi:hypothetical protein
MTVSCEDRCCGLLKILDRRHDKTDKRAAFTTTSLRARDANSIGPKYRKFGNFSISAGP